MRFFLSRSLAEISLSPSFFSWNLFSDVGCRTASVVLSCSFVRDDARVPRALPEKYVTTTTTTTMKKKKKTEKKIRTNSASTLVGVHGNGWRGKFLVEPFLGRV